MSSNYGASRASVAEIVEGLRRRGVPKRSRLIDRRGRIPASKHFARKREGSTGASHGALGYATRILRSLNKIVYDWRSRT